MDGDSLDRRVLYLLLFLDALVLFYRFGRDGRSRFRGVVLLNVSCGSGDGSPSLATTDADRKSDTYGGDSECDSKSSTRLRFEC